METRKPEFVLYGIASASDRYFVTGYRLIPAKFLSELYVKTLQRGLRQRCLTRSMYISCTIPKRFARITTISSQRTEITSKIV